jgi:hypothetical protein
MSEPPPSRPTMSRLIMPTIVPPESVGWATKYAEPRRPDSSPVKAANSTLRAGLGPAAIRSAARSTADTPEALSSAPL